MRFLADVCIARGVVLWLRSEGHDAAYLQELGLRKLPDPEIFARASAERRVVVTFDLDFGEIVALSPSPGASVIVFRLRDTSTPRVIERLRKVLVESGTEIEQNAVVVSVEESRHRIRAFPLKPESG